MKKVFGFCLVFLFYVSFGVFADANYVGNFTESAFLQLDSSKGASDMRLELDSQYRAYNQRVDRVTYISRSNRTSEINNYINRNISNDLPSRPSVGACYRATWVYPGTGGRETGYIIFFRWNGTSWQTVTYSYGIVPR